MQVSSKTLIEVKKGERIYSLQCPSDSPLGECFDALTELRAYILERIQLHSKDEVKEEVKE